MAANFKGNSLLQISRVFVLLCCFIAVVYIEKASNSHVLGMANLNYVSHNRVLWKIGKELQAKGHKYTQVLPNCAKERYMDIDVKIFNTSVTNEDIEESHLILMKMDDINSVFGAFKLLKEMQNKIGVMVKQFCNDLFGSDHLISEIKQSVDLLLCDTTNFCCPVLAAALNITWVDVAPVGFAGVFGAVIYNTPISYLPLESTPDSSDAFSFINRLKSFMVFVAIRSVSSTFSKMGSQESLGKYASKAVVDTTKSSVISLIPHDFALEYPRPLTPNVKMIGPVLPEVAGKLPDDLETFMTDSKQVVVVSFGTTLSNYRPDFIEMLADALGKLPFYVLWRQIGHLPEKISPNIKIVTWFPQNDLLGHPSTKVFLTHGGLNSFLESVYHAVPMVVIPLFGDQHKQAWLVKIKELGVSLDKNVIKSEDITRSITEVANNMKYKDNAQRISRLLRDRRQSPAEEGAYWIEYALKHQGAQHLMSSAYDMQLCQFYMFDVFLFVLVVIVVLVCMFLGLCYFMICQRKSKIPEKEKKT